MWNSSILLPVKIYKATEKYMNREFDTKGSLSEFHKK